LFSSVGGPLPKTFAVFCLTLLSFVPGTSGANGPQQHFTPPEDFTLLGDWDGQWQNPQRGHEVLHPELAAQLIYLNQGQCGRAISNGDFTSPERDGPTSVAAESIRRPDIPIAMNSTGNAGERCPNTRSPTS
jgi:hypothetical protein